MNGAEVDGRNIRVEKARRGSAYDKTPGRCTYIRRLKEIRSVVIYCNAFYVFQKFDSLCYTLLYFYLFSW